MDYTLSIIIKRKKDIGNTEVIAIRNGKTNGEIKTAIEAYKKANQELYEFLLEQSVKE